MLVKKVLKKILIKLCRSFGYEIIDQNQFSFPSLKNKKFDDLSNINQKSIVFPLGEVKITNKIQSLRIIIRTNSNIHISDQNKKRIFNKEKIEYIKKSLNSLVNSIKLFEKKFNQIKINLTIIDQSKNNELLEEFDKIFSKISSKFEIIDFDKYEMKDEVKVDYQKDIFGNLSSLLKCFKIAKQCDEDLIFFLEDEFFIAASITLTVEKKLTSITLFHSSIVSVPVSTDVPDPTLQIITSINPIDFSHSTMSWLHSPGTVTSHATPSSLSLYLAFLRLFSLSAFK